MHDKIIRILFIFRIILWITAVAATYYWISYSFKLYDMGIFDPYEYSSYLRPVLGKGLLIALLNICMSLILRTISDKIKQKDKMENLQ